MEDGSRKSFSRDDFFENFYRNSERLRALYRGDKVPPPHPFGKALGEATSLPPELERIKQDQERLDAQIG